MDLFKIAAAAYEDYDTSMHYDKPYEHYVGQVNAWNKGNSDKQIKHMFSPDEFNNSKINVMKKYTEYEMAKRGVVNSLNIRGR